MATPQITIRVPGEKLAQWKTACAHKETNVSEQLRVLMDAWSQEALGSSKSP